MKRKEKQAKKLQEYREDHDYVNSMLKKINKIDPEELECLKKQIKERLPIAERVKKLQKDMDALQIEIRIERMENAIEERDPLLDELAKQSKETSENAKKVKENPEKAIKELVDGLINPEMKRIDEAIEKNGRRIDANEEKLNKAQSLVQKIKQMQNLMLQVATQTLEDFNLANRAWDGVNDMLDTFEEVSNEPDPDRQISLLEVQAQVLTDIRNDLVNSDDGEIDLRAEFDRLFGVPNSLKIDGRLSRQASEAGSELG